MYANISYVFSDVGDSTDLEGDPQQHVDHDDMAFTKLLSMIKERLGSNCFSELQLFLLNIKCPNGCPLFNADSLYNHKSVDGLLLPLLRDSFLTPRDLDILIHILNGLKRPDLLSLISAYVPKVTVGKPCMKSSGNCDEKLIVQVVLNEALKRIDLGIISAIKHDLCACFGMQLQPYLMQYIGWQSSPITLMFQVPTACFKLVEGGLKNSISHLSGNGIDYIKVCIHSITLTFHTVS